VGATSEPRGDAANSGADDAATHATADGVAANELRYAWSTIYTPAWDDNPGVYVEHGLVAWGYSRRLAKVVAESPATGQRAFKAYLGVQHYDPGRWDVAGEPRAAFFLSIFLDGRTLALHTYPTMAQARTALESAHRRIRAVSYEIHY